MKYLLLFLTTAAFANYVTGPEAQIVYMNKNECERIESKPCYEKGEDHTVTRIINGKLVADSQKLALRKKENSDRIKKIQDKIDACETSKDAMKDAEDLGQAAYNYIKDCLL